jgi:acyl carrier protein
VSEGSAPDAAIRSVLSVYGHLGVDAQSLRDDDDLYEAGMTSHATVDVMLALEDAFDVMFPERMLRKRTFESLGSIRAAVAELAGGGTVGADAAAAETSA